jgi:hypothetical protein
MSVVAALSSDALRSTLEQLIDGLEIELVYPQQTLDAMADPAQRIPGTVGLSTFSALKYYFSFPVKLTRPDPAQPFSRPLVELDDDGNIHLHDMGVVLTGGPTIHLALIFTPGNLLSLSMPFSLPFELPVPTAIPIATARFPDAVLELGPGKPMEVFRTPFSTQNLFENLQSRIFLPPENGLELHLELPDLKLLEFSIQTKLAVVSTTRKEKITNPDGSQSDIDVPCWGPEVYDMHFAVNPLPLGVSLFELLFTPLRDAAVTIVENALVELLMNDPLFFYTHASLSEFGDYLAAVAEEIAAQAEKLIAEADRALKIGVRDAAQNTLEGCLWAEREAKEAYDHALTPADRGLAYTAWQTAIGATNLAREALTTAQQAVDEAERRVREAEQTISSAQTRQQTALGRIRNVAREIIQPRVQDYFKLEREGANYLLALLDLTMDDLSRKAIDWLDDKTGLINSPGGLADQLNQFLVKNLSYILAPKLFEVDLYPKLPQAMRDRLKLLRLGIPLPDQPTLTIRKKELSLQIEIPDIT